MAAGKTEITIPAVVDPCPSCQVPLLVIAGAIRSARVELFSVGGPPALGGQAHVRPHAADCADHTGSTEHPGTRPVDAPAGRVVADFTNLGFALDSNITYADEEVPGASA
jgi:hypothetical protein